MGRDVLLICSAHDLNLPSIMGFDRSDMAEIKLVKIKARSMKPGYLWIPTFAGKNQMPLAGRVGETRQLLGSLYFGDKEMWSLICLQSGLQVVLGNCLYFTT